MIAHDDAKTVRAALVPAHVFDHNELKTADDPAAIRVRDVAIDVGALAARSAARQVAIAALATSTTRGRR